MFLNDFQFDVVAVMLNRDPPADVNAPMDALDLSELIYRQGFPGVADQAIGNMVEKGVLGWVLGKNQYYVTDAAAAAFNTAIQEG